MLGTMLKVLGFFFLCFIILSIPIKDKTIFDHLFNASKPVGETIADKAEEGFDKTKKFSRSLFQNSVPKKYNGEDRDEVRSIHSSTRKKPSNEKPYDDYSESDEQALEKEIKSNSY